ncbi:TrkA C-terminal domain-containing protein [Brunnivagina elsteri]|uniref:Potassium transporter TrkA n=1 Tax=Brunnivagina elsteri CCALA 953 TaxID=987040 RepID=A0A2A2THD5_9CYAN|nr:TrkA C-terminal domain-containing protein [Calothrix elsteri]PAX53045.1 potassium transporter TrkA [Calothrix elsteri CCALA 953]
MSLGLTTVKIQLNSSFCGISVNNLQLPESCFLLAIVRMNHIILASAEPEIWCGDDLLAVALNLGQLPALNIILKQTHPIYYSFNECFLNHSTYLTGRLINSCYKDLSK